MPSPIQRDKVKESLDWFSSNDNVCRLLSLVTCEKDNSLWGQGRQPLLAIAGLPQAEPLIDCSDEYCNCFTFQFPVWELTHENGDCAQAHLPIMRGDWRDNVLSLYFNKSAATSMIIHLMAILSDSLGSFKQRATGPVQDTSLYAPNSEWVGLPATMA